MAAESLILTPPSSVGAGIDLNGTKWRIQELSLGNPSRREDLVTSNDSHGGMPARVSMRDAREVTATLRLMDAANMNAALESIGDLEQQLELAERLASSGPTNPVEECVRLVYTPKDSTQTYSLIVLTGEISEIPRDHQGWLIGYPTVEVRFICDPFAYGALRSYLDTTTTAEIAPSISVPGGPGDVSPWTRMAIKDTAAIGRGLLRIGVKNTALNTTATDFDGSDDRITTTYGTRRNLCVNPRAEVDTTGITTVSGTTTRVALGGSEPAAITDADYAFKYYQTSGGGMYFSFPATSGTTYTFSFWAYIASADAAALQCLRIWDGSGNIKLTVAVTPDDAWHRITGTVTADSTGTWRAGLTPSSASCRP